MNEFGDEKERVPLARCERVLHLGRLGIVYGCPST